MRMRFCATIRKPAFSIRALIAPVMFRPVASGLMIEKVRSIAMMFPWNNGGRICGAYIGAMPDRQATGRVATSDITPLRRQQRTRAGLALAVPVIDQSLRKRLNRRAGKRYAGKFPAVSLKMNTYAAIAFRVAEADQKFDGLY